MSDGGQGKLTSHSKEYVKQYFVYDEYGRTTQVYTAYVYCPLNGPCNLTEYTYVTDTNRVVKMRESDSIWLAAMEM